MNWLKNIWKSWTVGDETDQAITKSLREQDYETFGSIMMEQLASKGFSREETEVRVAKAIETHKELALKLPFLVEEQAA